MNLLEALGIADNEDAVTNLLRHCFLHSAPFREAFLSSICGIAEPGDGWDARARVHVPGLGTPDLVLFRKEPPGTLVILENKLRAGEGKDQTKKYADPACAGGIAHQLGLEPNPRTHLRFLTLFPETARSERFTSCTYQALLRFPPPLGADSLTDQLVEALYDLLTRFYAHSDLADDDHLIERLTGGGTTLDGGYLAFQAFVERLALPEGVERLTSYRDNWQGRKTYGALFSKKSWRSSRIDASRDRWQLEPDNRHIHLEPRLNALSHTFSLQIHYETYPYYPVRKLKARVPADQYQAYEHRRAEFKKRLARHTPEHFKVSGRTNQIARANLSLEGRTVGESAELLTSAMERATSWIDQTLQEELR